MIPTLQLGQFGLSATQTGDPTPGYLSPFWPTTLYSMRLRNAAYTGKCLRVRNTTTNTETDIGFDLDGWCSAAELAACITGSQDLRVTTWYDQSGSAKDVTQSTGSKQPIIVQAGVVLTRFSKPAMVWDSGPAFLGAVTDAVFGFSTGAWTIEAFAEPQSLDSSVPNTIVDFRAAGGAGYHDFLISTTFQIGYYNGTSYGWTSGTVLANNNFYNLAWSYPGGASTNLKQFVNGVAQVTTSLTLDGGTTKPILIGQSRDFNNSEWSGYIVELAICNGTNQYPSDFTPRSYS